MRTGRLWLLSQIQISFTPYASRLFLTIFIFDAVRGRTSLKVHCSKGGDGQKVRMGKLNSEMKVNVIGMGALVFPRKVKGEESD